MDSRSNRKARHGEPMTGTGSLSFIENRRTRRNGVGEGLPIFVMSPNQATPAEESIRFSPLAAAQPLNILSRPETLNAEAPGAPAGWPSAAMPAFSLISLSSPKKLVMVSLRQVSFGKEEETRTLKPFVETLRVRIPPGKAGPAARSESCVVVGRPILRSVDSEV